MLTTEKLSGLKSQLQRQRDTYQNVIAENERRLAQANEQLTQTYTVHDKR